MSSARRDEIAAEIKAVQARGGGQDELQPLWRELAEIKRGLAAARPETSRREKWANQIVHERAYFEAQPQEPYPPPTRSRVLPSAPVYVSAPTPAASLSSGPTVGEQSPPQSSPSGSFLGGLVIFLMAAGVIVAFCAWLVHDSSTPDAPTSATCQRIDGDREVAKGAYLISDDFGAFNAELDRLNGQAQEVGCSMAFYQDLMK